MKVKIDIDNQIYELPLTSRALSKSSAETLAKDTSLLSSVIPENTPGTLTINDVKYSVYKRQELQSLVPSFTGTTISNEDTGKDRVIETQEYVTSPVKFSEEEAESLVDILKILANSSHTHSNVDSQKNASTVQTVESNNYYCDHCGNNNNHVNRGDHCDQNGYW